MACVRECKALFEAEYKAISGLLINAVIEVILMMRPFLLIFSDIILVRLNVPITLTSKSKEESSKTLFLLLAPALFTSISILFISQTIFLIFFCLEISSIIISTFEDKALSEEASLLFLMAQ